MALSSRNCLPVLAGLLYAACVPSHDGRGGASASPSPSVVAAEESSSSGRVIPHSGFNVDPEDSLGCLNCHDGGLATSISTPRNLCASCDSHPSFTPYPPPGRQRNFQPLATVIAQGIRLPNGKVTCISCHDIEKDNRKLLAVDDKGSQLCFVCHRI